jgi:DNA-binding MarR family transcriptional regulator
MSNRFRKLEKAMKGVASHRRIQMLTLIDAAEGVDVSGLSDKTGQSMRSTSEHLKRLEAAGLVSKKSEGRRVTVTVTPGGSAVLAFLGSFDPR